MTSPINQLPQLIGMVEGIRNDRQRLAQQDRQLDMTEQSQAVSQGYTQAATLAQLMQMATGVDSEIQGYIGELVNTRMPDGSHMFNTEALGQLAGKIPQSTTFYAGKEAKRGDERGEAFHSRVMANIDTITDPEARDVVRNAFSQSMSGMGAGTARQQAGLSDREMIPEDQMRGAIQMQLGLVMTPQQMEQFKIARGQLAQGWAQLADQRDFQAFDDSLQSMELIFRMNNAGPAGGTAGGKGPVEIVNAIRETTTEMSKAGLSEAARAALGAGLNALMHDLGRVAAQTGNAELSSIMNSVTPQDIAQIAPKSINQWLVDKLIPSMPSNPAATGIQPWAAEKLGLFQRSGVKEDGSFSGWGPLANPPVPATQAPPGDSLQMNLDVGQQPLTPYQRQIMSGMTVPRIVP